MGDDLSITVCLLIVTVFAFYLLVHFSYLYFKTKLMNNVETAKYSKQVLKSLMSKALKTLKENANTIAHPYFHSQPIQYILSLVPSYMNVLVFCKYIIEYPDSQNDVNNILIELYGIDYVNSKELRVLVRVQTTEYGIDEHFHYIIEDVAKGIAVYVHNKEYLDKNLKIT